VRYRATYPLAYLKKKFNIGSRVVYPGYSPERICNFVLAYLEALLFRKKHSLIVIQRVSSGFIYARLLKLLVKCHRAHSVYDLDDADYLEKDPSTIFHFLKHCGSVSVGSTALQSFCLGFNSHVKLNTSPVPDLGIVKKARNKTLTIGWIGDYGGDHRQSLQDVFFPSLEKLPFRVILVLKGVRKTEDVAWLRSFFANMQHVDLRIAGPTDWSDEHSIQLEIATWDIGIATLSDNELHRSKSAFKLKQYMNNGVPVLSTGLPENDRFIIDGVNGFICNTSATFRERIIQLQDMQQNAYSSLSNGAIASKKGFNHHYYTNRLKLWYYELEKENQHQCHSHFKSALERMSTHD
jgi:hypothetical protein